MFLMNSLLRLLSDVVNWRCMYLGNSLSGYQGVGYVVLSFKVLYITCCVIVLVVNCTH